jgi:hypothetical protein
MWPLAKKLLRLRSGFAGGDLDLTKCFEHRGCPFAADEISPRSLLYTRVQQRSRKSRGFTIGA